MLCRRYLICSLTVSGLQKLIDIANMYITSHGLSFNPSKTECIIFGNCYFKSRPSWVLEGVTLTESDFINYFGVILFLTLNRIVTLRIALMHVGRHFTVFRVLVCVIWSLMLILLRMYGIPLLDLYCYMV